MGKLMEGTRMRTLLNGEVVIDEWLADGGQGDVYRVSYNGTQKALKWYKQSGMGGEPGEFYKNLKNNVMTGPPSPEFLWPLDLIEPQQEGGVFGYVMDLKPQGYYEVSDFMLRRAVFASYRTAADAAMQIVSAFRLLHNKGYSYQDLNDGNFFINPLDGKVLIADNDNVAPDHKKTGIIGKPRYMAPEIVMRKSMPNSLSDRYSMSVILFILFVLNHPLEGKRSLAAMSPARQEKLYGSHALFIMDEDNRANAPDPVCHKNALTVWPQLPDYMRALFSKAFGQKALKNPNARPAEYEWIDCLARFRSEIISCRCGNEIFTEQGQSRNCDSCGRRITIPYRLKLRSGSIPGAAGSWLYRCQLGTCNADEALNREAHVVANKSDPNMLGIKNLGKTAWSVKLPDGSIRQAEPGRLVPLRDGISIGIATKAGTETIDIIKND